MNNFFNKYFYCGLLLLAMPWLIQAEIFNYRESGGAVTVMHTLTFMAAVAGGYDVELNTTQPDGQVIHQTFRTPTIASFQSRITHHESRLLWGSIFRRSVLKFSTC